jgi:hypothetical protein
MSHTVCAFIPFLTALGGGVLGSKCFLNYYTPLTSEMVSGARGASEASQAVACTAGLMFDIPMVLMGTSLGFLVGANVGFAGGYVMRRMVQRYLVAKK